jgi:hypothetical protein
VSISIGFSTELHLYPSRTPDVMASVGQRNLFRWWDRRRLDSPVPPVSALADETVVPLLGECIYYQVLESAEGVDFLATSHGADVHPLFGQRLVGTLLTSHVAQALTSEVVETYRVAVEAKRPVFTIRRAKDDRGAPVQLEILRLPLGEDGTRAEAILSHFSTTGLGPQFSRKELVTTGSTEEYLLKAVIMRR